MPRKLNLDVDSPEKVPPVLREAAEAYYESAEELSRAWQSRAAGQPWIRIARVFERLADHIERELRP